MCDHKVVCVNAELIHRNINLIENSTVFTRNFIGGTLRQVAQNTHSAISDIQFNLLLCLHLQHM